MRTKKVDLNQQQEVENERSMKGTLFSIGIVGAVILVTWIGIFGLYMFRA